jgi:hypothetical protein
MLRRGDYSVGTVSASKSSHLSMPRSDGCCEPMATPFERRQIWPCLTTRERTLTYMVLVPISLAVAYTEHGSAMRAILAPLNPPSRLYMRGIEDAESGLHGAISQGGFTTHGSSCVATANASSMIAMLKPSDVARSSPRPALCD